MSFYQNPASNNPLAFPSYNQQPVQRGNPVHLQRPPTKVNEISAKNESANVDVSDTAGLPENADKVPKRERKNRPGQKFGAKKKSWVWSWFVQDNSDPNVASCDYCGKIITRLVSDKGSPKKLSEHLKTHKLSRDSVNSSRTIPIDGNGVTYAPNGMPLNYPNNYPSTAGSSANAVPGVSSGGNPGVISLPPTLTDASPQDDGDPAEEVRRKQMKFSRNGDNYGIGRRYLSTNFDNSPYSSMKFHKHLMSFLTENKLPINVIKSHAFQQLVYDLRSDSVADLYELTKLYSSLIEVSRFDGDGTGDPNSVHEANVVNTLTRELNKK